VSVLIKEKNNNKRIVEMIGMSKSFPGVKAVDNVNFTLESGWVHAIVGENGAGKSTLMKLLAGVYRRDAGIIKINGKEVIINEPADSKRFGISIIEQEFSLFSELNVFQNMFLGKEYSRKAKFLIDWGNIKRKTSEILKEIGLDVGLDRPIKKLKTSEQQLLEIAKAIFFGANFIIMDEPTSSLGAEEKKKLFSIIRELRNRGVGIIYISHRMEEIFDIADHVTVMRDGRKVGTYKISEVDESKLIELMVGRELSNVFYRDRSKVKVGNIVLEIKNLTKKGHFENISFNVKEGEVLGLSGLMGSQRTEIVSCIFGLDKFNSGEIYLNQKKVKFSDASQAIKNGIGMVPEDRKRDGIIHTMNVRENVTIASLQKISKAGWINYKMEEKSVSDQVKSLDIKIVSFEQPAIKLSGGNQQKVVLGRFLALKPKLLILDEPTRGIDIGAKAEVHKIISEIAKNGVAVIMISSELPEILGASDRIVVLCEGRITDELSYKEATQEKILSSALK
jgi:ribose transport system ATP-binding protein